MDAHYGEIQNCLMVGLAKKLTAKKKKSKIHNLEETWRNIDWKSGSSSLKVHGTEGNTEMEICVQIFAGLPQSVYHFCFIKVESICARNLTQHLYHLWNAFAIIKLKVALKLLESLWDLVKSWECSVTGLRRARSQKRVMSWRSLRLHYIERLNGKGNVCICSI